MLGKTHEVTAPTGLPKVMESALPASTGIPRRRLNHALRVVCGVSAWAVHPKGLARRPGCPAAGGPRGVTQGPAGECTCIQVRAWHYSAHTVL